jgi:hypothetical protein
MAVGEGGGAAVAYAGGSSSSLREKYKFGKQGKNNASEVFDYNTYDARM